MVCLQVCLALSLDSKETVDCESSGLASAVKECYRPRPRKSSELLPFPYTQSQEESGYSPVLLHRSHTGIVLLNDDIEQRDLLSDKSPGRDRLPRDEGNETGLGHSFRSVPEVTSLENTTR